MLKICIYFSQRYFPNLPIILPDLSNFSHLQKPDFFLFNQNLHFYSNFHLKMDKSREILSQLASFWYILAAK